MNYDLFFKVTVIVIGINFVCGLIIAIVANNYRNRAIYLISTNVVNMKKVITNIIVTNPMFNELQKIVQQKNMPIVIISDPVSRKRIKATLINKEMIGIDQQNILSFQHSVTEIIKGQLDNYLFWSEYLTGISIFPIVLGTFSLMLLAIMVSVQGLIALIFITLFILLLVPFGILINYSRKRRNIKVV